MIGLNAPRVRPSNREQTPSDKTPASQARTYPAPIGGWVSNANMASQSGQTAVVLDNFWPTETGIVPRGGSALWLSIPNPVECLFEYGASAPSQFFVADETNIYPFTASTPAGTTLTPVITGQTSGDYAVLETQTDGGSFVTLVNGADPMQVYDGSAWQQVTASSSPFNITGVATDQLSHVWSYNKRQYFIQKGTMNAWYLGVNSVAGPAVKLPLNGVFRRGGSLLFGASWSSDSGEDMNDRCVFVTDRGEFAVYRGDPASANTWHFDGVFDIGEPLGPRAVMSVGGDLIVATKTGLIPLSAAVQKDVAELKVSALSRAIDPDWRNEVALSGPHSWSVVKWPSRNMALVAPPQGYSGAARCFAVNLGTGAWAQFTGWDVAEMALLGDALHFGDAAGGIYRADVGGTDDGRLISCRMCLAFDHLGSPGAFKVAGLARGTFKHSTPFDAKFSVARNYQPEFPSAPSASGDGGAPQSAWDTAGWDTSEWGVGSSAWEIAQKWNSVSAHGYTLAPQMQITSGAPYRLDCELVSIDLTYTTGGVAT